MRRVSQPVLPLLPAGAIPIGAVTGLVEDADGGVVYLAGLVTFTFAAADEQARRLVAVQLVTGKLASMVEVADAFATSTVSLWRWKEAFSRDGVAGLAVAKAGPKGPRKLTAESWPGGLVNCAGKGCRWPLSRRRAG